MLFIMSLILQYFCVFISMFLTKKTLNKNKDKNKNSKALGGWGDDDHDPQPLPKTLNTPTIKITTDYLDMESNDSLPVRIPNYQPSESSNPFLSDRFEAPVPSKQTHQEKQKKQQMFYDADELAELPKIDCQKKLVFEITEPGGVRIKPNDKMLVEFNKECRSLDIAVIGSLLINILNVEEVCFQSMAKSLYVIEYLAKKNQQYLIYFKLHVDKIKSSLEPDENIDNFRKIKKTALNAIGDVFRDDQKRQEESIQFNDPGYGKQKGVLSDLLETGQQEAQKKPKQKVGKKLVSPNQMKKKLSGPNQVSKQILKSSNKQTQDLLQIQDDKPVANLKKKSINLLDEDEGEQKPSEGVLTYEDLISKQKEKKQIDLLQM